MKCRSKVPNRAAGEIMDYTSLTRLERTEQFYPLREFLVHAVKLVDFIEAVDDNNGVIRAIVPRIIDPSIGPLQYVSHHRAFVYERRAYPEITKSYSMA